MADITKTYTIEEFIAEGSSTEISYDKLSIFENVDGLYLVTHNVLDDYKKEIDRCCRTIVLSTSEMNKYRYKPKLLAYDIYGSTELFFIILFTNNMCDVKEFDKKKLRLLPQDSLEEIISYIYQSQQAFLSKNRQNMEG